MSDKNGDRKRSKRGLGRLYKRVAGKEYRSDSPVTGNYWLEYTVEGKRRREALYDKKGKPITKREDAEKIREVKIGQNKAAAKVDLKAKYIRELRDEEEELATAIEAAAIAENPPLTIKAAWRAYASSADRPDSGEATLYNYEGHWGRFTGWLSTSGGKAAYLRDVTPEMARGYARYLIRERKVSANTHNKHIIFLRSFFNVLADAARLDANPFDGIRSKQEEQHSRRELSIAELKTILAAATGELEGLLYLGTFTGLRMGDCCTLKWGEVDLDRQIITRIPNKTKRRKRVPVKIGIPNALHAYLSAFPPSVRKGYVLPSYAEKYLYANTSGKPIRRTSITNDVKKLFMICEIQIHAEGTGYKLEPDSQKPGKFIRVSTGKRAVVEVGFHSLRHTYVSLHAERGTPQAVVQAVVGHWNPAMTAHYTHIGEDAARNAGKQLDLAIVDAQFELIPDPAMRAAELLGKANAKNWKKTIEEALEILKGMPDRK